MGDFVAYNSRWRVALIVLGCAVFVVAGLWMGGAFGPPPSSPRYPDAYVLAVGWLTLACFSFFGVIAVKRLFDTSMQLQIGPSGIYWAPWSDKTIPWSEIFDVTTWQKIIVLHLHHPARFPGRGTAAMIGIANRKLAGGNIWVSLTGTNRSFDEAMSEIARFRR